MVGVPGTRDENRFHIYAVTNRHVITKTPGYPVVRINTKEGDSDDIDLGVEQWEFAPEPTDLAVAPIAIETSAYRFKFLTEEQFLTRDLIASENIGPGDDAFMTGRFINHQGVQRNLPSVRFGNISMMPDEPIDGQESFAVEMRSIGGFSGSPVFVYVMPFAPRPGSETGYGDKHQQWFLGVDWGHIFAREPVRTKDGKEHPDGLFLKSNSGVIGVAPAWKLSELLHSDRLRHRRDEEERRVLEDEASRSQGVERDVASEPPTTDDNPRHREDFNSLLDAAVRRPPKDDQT